MIFKKGDIEVRDFKSSDIEKIRRRVRKIDREDIQVLFNLSPEQSLIKSVKVSTYVLQFSKTTKSLLFSA